MKKLGLLVTVVAFIIGIIACGGGGKYGEAKSVMEDYATSTETFVNALENSGSADDVADALNAYASDIEKFAPKMKEIMEKYPELQTQKAEDIPEELKAVNEKFEKIMPKMFGAMAKVQPYANDPKVVEANKRFEAAFSKMGE